MSLLGWLGLLLLGGCFRLRVSWKHDTFALWRGPPREDWRLVLSLFIWAFNINCRKYRHFVRSILFDPLVRKACSFMGLLGVKWGQLMGHKVGVRNHIVVTFVIETFRGVSVVSCCKFSHLGRRTFSSNQIRVLNLRWHYVLVQSLTIRRLEGVVTGDSSGLVFKSRLHLLHCKHLVWSHARPNYHLLWTACHYYITWLFVGAGRALS